MRARLARTLFAAAFAAGAAAVLAGACNPNVYDDYTLGGPGDGSGGDGSGGDGSGGGGQGQQGGGGSAGAGGDAGLRCEGEGQEACNNSACQNCDADGAGSCETDTSISSTNCGACGRSCLTTTCAGGQCQSASVTSGVQVSTRLVSGGGFLYWVSTPDQIDTLPGDAVYRIDVANGGQVEQAYVPADALEIFDLAANATGFYLVTDQGVKTRGHGTTGELTTLSAPEQNTALAALTAPALARISANENDVFFTAPLQGNTAQVWSVPKAGGPAKALTTIDSGQISMLVADAGGVFVGSGAKGAGDPGVSYVPNVEGGGKSTVYGGNDVVVGDFAVSGDDLIIVDTSDTSDKLVAVNRVDKQPVTLKPNTSGPLRALAADESGLYYLAYDLSNNKTSLMRVRREPGADSLGEPTTLLDEVTGAARNLPLALDASWVYGVSSGTTIFHVPK
ncbi:MAG TPA: hypothetical protein VFS43_15800 [Polyangiaceae bacterium]|nr:hypothetical protein [Polyangiaceae bacterium]